VRLVEWDPDAERKVVAAALFPYSNLPLAELDGRSVDADSVLRALVGNRSNRRHKAPRAFEHATYTFEIVANFAAYRDLQRHRMLTQDRQVLGTALGADIPPELAAYGMRDAFEEAIDRTASAHRMLERAAGPAVAQYAVPLAFRLRWYMRASLREVVHLCELRTTPQGHPDYRWVAQELYRRVAAVQPRLALAARFVDLSEGDELERRASERRIDEKIRALEARV
jgi:thymidylate synthase ThyX